jgi:Calcium binding
MPKPELTASREQRIADEILVDACGLDEVASAWYCYLEGKLKFPFVARCADVRTISPLRLGEQIEVLGLAIEDECAREAFVLVAFAGRRLGVPLSQLEVVRGSRETHEAVDDWRCWMALGQEL